MTTLSDVYVPCVSHVQVPGYFYANDRLEELTFEELRQQSGGKGGGGFLPAVKQIANVAALPGIVKVWYCSIHCRVECYLHM